MSIEDFEQSTTCQRTRRPSFSGCSHPGSPSFVDNKRLASIARCRYVQRQHASSVAGCIRILPACALVSSVGAPRLGLEAAAIEKRSDPAPQHPSREAPEGLETKPTLGRSESTHGKLHR